MTREEVIADPSLSPLAKLVLDELVRRPDEVHNAKSLAKSVGVLAHQVAEVASELRRRDFCAKNVRGAHLPLSELCLLDHVRLAYLPARAVAPQAPGNFQPVSKKVVK